jgi:hypothetical protein
MERGGICQVCGSGERLRIDHDHVTKRADIYFDDFLVGQQVNAPTLAYDEVRYLDNVSFSSQRIEH